MKLKAIHYRVDDGRPHHVSLVHDGIKGIVSVDGKERRYVVAGYQSEQLRLDDHLYLGGFNVDKHHRRGAGVGVGSLPQELWSAVRGVGYVGCVQDFSLNGERVNLVALARDQEVVGLAEFCRQPSTSACLSYPCLHNGACRDGWNRFVCDCTATGYRGSVCRLGKQRRSLRSCEKYTERAAFRERSTGVELSSSTSWPRCTRSSFATGIASGSSFNGYRAVGGC